MEQLPATVEARLRELSNRFERDLPERIREIRGLSDQAELGRVESLRALRQRVHRLAGSATTFGFEGVSVAAGDAERAIERDLASDEQRLRPDTLELLAALRTAAERPTANTAESSGDDHGGAHVVARRLVVGLGDDLAPEPALAQQLSVFGIAFLQFDEPDDARTELEARLESGEIEYAILLSTVEFFWGHKGRCDTLSEIRETFTDRVQLFVVGASEEFDARLRSVRLGATSFLAAPLEVVSLLDAIEGHGNPSAVAPYHVMVIDDDPEQVSSTALILQEAGMITSVVTDPRSVFQFLVEHKPELILLDMYMPQLSGPELASIIRQNDSFVSVPIVFLSVETDQTRQSEAIGHGADDFLVKPIDPKRLVATVRARASRTRAMRHYMERDSLTGLLNHTNIKQRLDHELQRAARMGTELSFAMIDIDHFKQVNDHWGHMTGDRVIKSLARLLSERLRRTDVVGRYGGEEFAVILFNTDIALAQRVLDELREAFSQLAHFSGESSFTVTFSCGIAEYPRYETGHELNEAADSALYDAKQLGRNRVIASRR